MMRDFERQLAAGRLGEKLVAKWIVSHGWGVIPSYEFSGQDGNKAPRLVFANRRMAIPDLDVCHAGRRRWCEIKTYFRPVENRAHRALVHGAPARLIADYRAVQEATGADVWICVLEVQSGALLAVRLAGLEPWPCQCGPCRSGRPDICSAASCGIRAGVYWPRAAMTQLCVFDDGQMAPIREAWSGLVSALVAVQ